MTIDKIFQDNLKEKLSGILKEIPEWHLRGIEKVSLECLNPPQLKIDEIGYFGYCFFDGRIILDYHTVTNSPDIIAEHIFLHEVGHNVFNSLLPFRLKQKWAKACRENNLRGSPKEIFAEEYKNTILRRNNSSPLYNYMEEFFCFIEKNKERKCNGMLHKIISYIMYSKTKSI